MARDGEHKECPVVPNNIIRLRYGEGEDEALHVAATHDSVQMFPDPRYNYLRYYDTDTKNIIAVFLGQNVLADLVENGIPLSIRESITEGEVETYEHHIGKVAAAGMAMIAPVDEPLALGPGDPIDAEVQKAHEHFDAELSWFMGEWEEGRDGAS